MDNNKSTPQAITLGILLGIFLTMSIFYVKIQSSLNEIKTSIQQLEMKNNEQRNDS